MQKITPFLWFDNNAEEAMNFYTSVFKHSEIRNVSRYAEGGHMPAGTVMSASFRLEDQELILLNGGPGFPHSNAFSLFVNCKDQAEVDEYWDQLIVGGSAQKCGWLKDKYGVSWQIVPEVLGRLLADKDQARIKRVMEVMMQMVKLDAAVLQRAYDGQ